MLTGTVLFKLDERLPFFVAAGLVAGAGLLARMVRFQTNEELQAEVAAEHEAAHDKAAAAAASASGADNAYSVVTTSDAMGSVNGDDAQTSGYRQFH